jgi:hypothetical protein
MALRSGALTGGRAIENESGEDIPNGLHDQLGFVPLNEVTTLLRRSQLP